MKKKRLDRVLLRVDRGFAYVALWQILAFVMLILLVWADELQDLTSAWFGTVPHPMDVTRGCLATAGILVAAIVSVGNTYLQQRRIVRGLLTICSYCKKIRVDAQVWQQVEEYIHKRAPIQFTHSVCPECFQRVKGAVERETEARPPQVAAAP